MTFVNINFPDACDLVLIDHQKRHGFKYKGDAVIDIVLRYNALMKSD